MKNLVKNRKSAGAVLLAAVLAVIFSLALVGCGDKASEDDTEAMNTLVEELTKSDSTKDGDKQDTEKKEEKTAGPTLRGQHEVIDELNAKLAAVGLPKGIPYIEPFMKLDANKTGQYYGMTKFESSGKGSDGKDYDFRLNINLQIDHVTWEDAIVSGNMKYYDFSVHTPEGGLDDAAETAYEQKVSKAFLLAFSPDITDADADKIIGELHVGVESGQRYQTKLNGFAFEYNEGGIDNDLRISLEESA